MKFLILTYGCAANQSDSQIMLSKMINAGHILVENEKDADLIIVNSCGVKKPTADKIFNKVGKLIEMQKKVIMAGCLPKIEQERLKNYKLFGVINTDIDQIVDAAEGKNVKKTGKINKAKLDKKCDDVYIIQIADGCLGACTYCGTRFARGALYSYPEEDIVEEVKKAVKLGVKTIYLTSQDDGAYGLDINTNISKLLEKIVKNLEGTDAVVRAGMMNPEHVKKQIKELISVYKHPNIMKFIHIPIQSGSNKVLKEMNRRYVVDEVKEIIKEFRKEIPKICVSTDIIVGYPTETEDDFQQTIHFVEEMKPNVLNMSKFFSRPNTSAEKLKPLAPEVLKQRSAKLRKTFEKIKKG